MDKTNLLQPVLLLFGFMAIYLFLNISSDMLPGSNWAEINAGLIQLWPIIMVFAFALYAFKEVVGRR